MAVKEKLEQGWLHVNIIIEILGKPAEHIEKVLELAIAQLGKEKGIESIKTNLHPAKLVEGSKSVFSCFAEAELLVESMSRLVEIIFDYMPASIEIVEPSNITFKLEDANALLNDLTARLHYYDALAKQLKLEREVLLKRLEQLKKGKH